MNTETVTILHDNQLVERMSLSKSHVNSDYFYLTLFETNLFLWQHFHISSFFLFSRTFESGGAITIFSVKQKSHFFVPHLYRDTYDFMLYFRWQSSRKVLGLFRIIISSDSKILMNKRFELISKYRHMNKFVLNSVKKSELNWHGQFSSMLYKVRRMWEHKWRVVAIVY